VAQGITCTEEGMASEKLCLGLITGGKTGIGKALALKMASWPCVHTVLAVSRSIKPEDVAESSKVVAMPADVTSAEGRAKIVAEVERRSKEGGGLQLRFLVHAAGLIDPIKSILEVTPEELRYAMSLNCESPLFLTTALYKLMEKQGDDGVAGRVLHVSTGACHGAPPVGWACYGITKAAFFQSYKVLEREFRELGSKVVVSSFKPGVVDTEMQGTIRSSDSSSMPMVQNFKNMKENAFAGESTKPHPPPKGGLDTPQNVAFFTEWLLLRTTDLEFGNKDDPNEYDIRNEELYPKWITSD